MGNAWIAAGGGEAYPNIATCPELGKWAVGTGGKKNGEKAAKLVLAIAIAKDDPPSLSVVIRNYPAFGRLLAYLGMGPAGMAPQEDYGCMGGMMGGKGGCMGGMMGGKGGMRFSPY